MADLAVTYSAAPVMSSLLDSDAFVRGIVGPVGSGKSVGCILEILRRAVEQKPGPDGVRRTRFAVVRNTYGQLRDTTRKTFEQWIPPALGEWREQEFTFVMDFNDVHCEVLFRALDRPEDVKKLLSLELTGAFVNEFREIARNVFDVLQTRVGRYPSRTQGGPTWFGVWFDTNPWHAGHWAQQLFHKKPEGHELYRQPSGRSKHAENVENLPPGYYERLCIGKDAEWIRVYVEGLEATSDVGSIYGALLDDLDKRGGLDDFELEDSIPEVFTSWDLGHDDATAIWFWRFDENRDVDFIDYYENHGQPMSFYFGLLEKLAMERGYGYAHNFLPPDARAKNLQTGSSILEMCVKEWGNKVSIVPSMSVADGLTAGRWLLEQSTRIHPRCVFELGASIGVDAQREERGLESLRQYRRKWDEDRKTFSSEPIHDWASHGADAFRYAAIVVRNAELSTRKPKATKDALQERINRGITLDDAWREHERSADRSERI